MKNLTNCKRNFNCSYQAFLVGKDFGAIPGYLTAALHPERVAAIITLCVPFTLPGHSTVKKDLLPKGFYITRWQVQIPSAIILFMGNGSSYIKISLVLEVIYFLTNFRSLGGQKQILAALM